MEYSIQELIRETKNAINTRLDMLESLISTKKICSIDIGTESLNETLHERISILENIVRDLQREEIPEVVIIEKNNEEHNDTDVNNESNKYNSENISMNCNYKPDENDADDEAAEEGEEGQAEEDEEGQAEEGEEESIKLTEFSYKGMTLYHDEENKVYQMGEDGELSDPIGIWDESKNRIKKLV